MMAKTEIPVLNLADFLAGKPGAHAAITKELQYAAENVGFFFIDGHGVPRDLVDATFEASRRFHALDEAEKMALKANNHNIGYMRPVSIFFIHLIAINKHNNISVLLDATTLAKIRQFWNCPWSLFNLSR